jgi:hypothetical protein
MSQRFLLRNEAIYPSGNNDAGGNNAARKKPDWYYGTAKYAEPSLSRAIFQLVDTFIPYFLLLGAIIYLVKADFAYWLSLPLSVIAGLLLVLAVDPFPASRHCGGS